MSDLVPSERALNHEPEAALHGSARAPKARPILFSGAMVRAVLAGTKTQTRRALRGFCPPGRPEYDSESGRLEWFNGDEVVVGMNCHYGAPGDRLWVRESGMISIDKMAWMYPDCGGALSPDAPPESKSWAREWKSAPSIHMPRWASRITLEITGVRVERLQDISDADARSEGVAYDPGEGGTFHVDGGCASDSAVDSYRRLWEQINGPGSWDANPWVWVLCFRKTASGSVVEARSNEQGSPDESI